jgi:quercetin dioxygenase-like cupin family protein
MKLIYYSFLLLAAFYAPLVAQETPLFPKGEKAPNVHHTGDVWLYHVSNADATFAYNLTLATFAPGAKLDWHLHPAGQQLLITDGIGYYQERDKPVQVVQKGDVIKCLPGVEHWHAATPDSDFAYLAITGNQPTQWLEKLTDEAYNSIKTDGMNNSAVGKEIIELSKEKWQWMAEKKVDILADLFHENAVFVHMGGSWGKEKELEIIQSGGIHYKQADIHEVSVNIIDDTAILLNRITLLAVVGGNEVTNPFMVTEVYKKQQDGWKLAALSFTKLLN